MKLFTLAKQLEKKANNMIDYNNLSNILNHIINKFNLNISNNIFKQIKQYFENLGNINLNVREFESFKKVKTKYKNSPNCVELVFSNDNKEYYVTVFKKDISMSDKIKAAYNLYNFEKVINNIFISNCLDTSEENINKSSEVFCHIIYTLNICPKQWKQEIEQVTDTYIKNNILSP